MKIKNRNNDISGIKIIDAGFLFTKEQRKEIASAEKFFKKMKCKTQRIGFTGGLVRLEIVSPVYAVGFNHGITRWAFQRIREDRP